MSKGDYKQARGIFKEENRIPNRKPSAEAEEAYGSMRVIAQTLRARGVWVPAGELPPRFGKYLCWITGTGLNDEYWVGLEVCDFEKTTQYVDGTWLQTGVTYWFKPYSMGAGDETDEN